MNLTEKTSIECFPNPFRHKAFAACSLLCILFFLACSTEQKSQQYFLKGNLALKEKDYKLAIKMYEAALQRDSQFIEALNNKGIAEMERGNTGVALEDFNQALLIDGNFEDAFFNRTNLFYRSGNLRSAARDAQRLVNDNPTEIKFQFLFGLIHYALEEKDMAMKAFNTVIQLDSTNAEAYVNRANLMVESLNFEKAIEDCDIALRLDPLESQAHNVKAIALAELKQFDKAIKTMTLALDQSPKDPYFLNNMGYIHLIQGQQDEGKEWLDKSLALDNKNSWLQRNLGLYYLSKENAGKAETALLKAIELSPVAPGAHLALAKLYHEGGDVEKACLHFQLEKGPKSDREDQLDCPTTPRN